MSALNILRLKDCAIMLTDAATYDIDTGVIGGFGLKQAAIASWPGAIGVRGSPPEVVARWLLRELADGLMNSTSR